MRLAVAGAAGRMGRTLAKIIHEANGLTLVAGIERPGGKLIGADFGAIAGLPFLNIPITDRAQDLVGKIDGVIDFTTPTATLELAKFTAMNGLVHVIGTTGFSKGSEDELVNLAQKAIIVKSGNMSLSVNLLAALVEKAASVLGEQFDIEISEMHHREKVDAPSGTALLLGEAAANGRRISLAENSIKMREGIIGTRPSGAIGFASLRGGSVVGDHSVIFAGNGERLNLSHVAETRDIFAHGAVKAALWAYGKKPGLYSMRNVLGID